MPETIKVQIRLYGAFRRCNAGAVEIAVAAGSNVRAIKEALGAELQKLDSAFCSHSLLEQSALASSSRVLDDADRVCADAQLAILPPVCGG